MSKIITLLSLGVSLSMDTFSIALSISTFNIKKTKMLLLVILVGIMHFLLPILGNHIGIYITNILSIKPKYILAFILLSIAIKMIIDLLNGEEKHFDLSIINIIIIAISVSLDSFSTGMGINAITNNYLVASTIFSVNASIFTYIGYIIGKYSSNKIGKYSQILGIIILIILSITHIF